VSIAGLWIGNPAMSRVSAARLFRLMKYLPTLHDLLLSAVSSLVAFANLLLFITSLGLAFVIGGRYSFRDNIDPATRSTFSDFGSGALTAIQLFVGDNWSSVVISAMDSKENGYAQFFAGLYVVAWFTFGRLVITNLFVAIIIENFEVANTIRHVQKPGRLMALREFVRAGRQVRDLYSQKSRTLCTKQRARSIFSKYP
jgi:hypothetical protein